MSAACLSTLTFYAPTVYGNALCECVLQGLAARGLHRPRSVADQENTGRKAARLVLDFAKRKAREHENVSELSAAGSSPYLPVVRVAQGPESYHTLFPGLAKTSGDDTLLVLEMPKRSEPTVWGNLKEHSRKEMLKKLEYYFSKGTYDPKFYIDTEAEDAFDEPGYPSNHIVRLQAFHLLNEPVLPLATDPLLWLAQAIRSTWFFWRRHSTLGDSPELGSFHLGSATRGLL